MPIPARDSVGRPAGDVDAFEFDRTGIGAFDPHHELHHGGFAGTVGPDQSKNLAWTYLEADIVDRDESAETLGKPANF